MRLIYLKQLKQMRPPEESACRRSIESEFTQNEAGNLLGDFSALLQQLGPGAAAPFRRFSTDEINSLPALQQFLSNYLTQILLPVELAAITQACAHVRQGQARELVELDQRISGATEPSSFADASRKAGTAQLHRLRPLRDERTVQRYLQAVDSGAAAGWHTLAYGLVMAVYCIPLRQGLLHYARATLTGLARASARFSEEDCAPIIDSLLAQIPPAVEQIILSR
jgi:urease accessory protein UreF